MHYISKLFSLKQTKETSKIIPLRKKALVPDLKIMRIVALGKEVQQVGAEARLLVALPEESGDAAIRSAISLKKEARETSIRFYVLSAELLSEEAK